MKKAAQIARDNLLRHQLTPSVYRQKKEELKVVERQIGALRVRANDLRVELHIGQPRKVKQHGCGRPSRYTMSDHGLIRFLERVKGIDIERLREIATPSKVIWAMNEGLNHIVVDGMVYIINDRCVVSVMTPEMYQTDPHEQLQGRE